MKVIAIQFRIGLLIIAALILCIQPVFGSGGGAINVGTLTTGANVCSDAREWIELHYAGGLLIGNPDRESVELITVYAPGCYEGHLILRVLELPDGRSYLLLTAPGSLSKKTLRATIYVRHNNADLMLFEYIAGNWQYRKPYLIRTTNTRSRREFEDVLLAFSVKELGAYWILPGNSPGFPDCSNIPQHHSPSSLFGGGIYGGMRPWMWAVLLLGIGWFLSHWMHRIERRRCGIR